MPRYVFDVHDDGPALWGEAVLECNEHGPLKKKARELIEQAQQRQAARGVSDVLTTVFVHQDSNGIILTAYGRPGSDVRLVWAAS